MSVNKTAANKLGGKCHSAKISVSSIIINALLMKQMLLRCAATQIFI